jgi:hypothetical protein
VVDSSQRDVRRLLSGRGPWFWLALAGTVLIVVAGGWFAWIEVLRGPSRLLLGRNGVRVINISDEPVSDVSIVHDPDWQGTRTWTIDRIKSGKEIERFAKASEVHLQTISYTWMGTRVTSDIGGHLATWGVPSLFVIDGSNVFFPSSLTEAVVEEDLSEVSRLLARGYPPNDLSSLPTPLWLAVRLRNVPIAEALLQAGADPDLRTLELSPQSTPRSLALRDPAYQDLAELFELYVPAGADSPSEESMAEGVSGDGVSDEAGE